MAKVLIIDDDQTMCTMLSSLLRRKGYEVTCANTLEDGLKKAVSEAFDVAFLDVQMPDGNGLDMLPRLRAISSAPEVVIITGAADPDGAEIAIKSGAWDYLEKPASIMAMTIPLVRAIQYREEKKAEAPPVALKRQSIIGSSPPMRACFDLLAQVAGSQASVLVTGETGTGKELFARAIHENSRRSQGNFVVVDCAALPETLVESVLFGHEKGVFTGADKARDGLIVQADGGTLFLDEVGELSLSLQKAFLRVLQERHFRPLGGKKEIESDFRLVAATNQALDQKVESGQFRQDLLFRLRSFAIELPPLRDRTDDIKEMVSYHLDKLCQRYEIKPKNFSDEFLEALILYDWPGNIRELFNTLERALAAAGQDHILFPKHLPTSIRIHVAKASLSLKKDDHEKYEKRVYRDKGIKAPREQQGVSNYDLGSKPCLAAPWPLYPPVAKEQRPPLRARPPVSADFSMELPKLGDFRAATLAQAERRYLHELMSLTAGNIKEACVRSGLSRSRLYALLKQHGISNFN